MRTVMDSSTWHLVLTISLSSFLVCFVSCLPAKKDVINMIEKVNVVEFDWRTKGVISGVLNQGNLGQAVDFVITEEVESLHAIETESSVTLLSRQEVTDCCDDASTHQPKYKGFDCIVQIGGLCSMTGYRNKGRCGNDTCTAIAKVGSTGYIPAGREDIMMQVILQVPLAVYIDASRPSFEEYSSGIYSDPACQAAKLDHVMQVVGYGSENGQDYWILKNSWGSTWGEQGYMRIARGKNTCGLANQAFYPMSLEQTRPFTL